MYTSQSRNILLLYKKQIGMRERGTRQLGTKGRGGSKFYKYVCLQAVSAKGCVGKVWGRGGPQLYVTFHGEVLVGLRSHSM